MNANPSRPLPRAAARLARILALACSVTLASTAWALSPPVIDSFSPDRGPVGTTIVIDGANFVSLQSVYFGGHVQASGSYTASKVTAIVPFGAETGPITITTAAGSVATSTDFIVGESSTPEATLVATIPTVTVGSGRYAEFTVALSRIRAQDTVVHYLVKGNAIDGTDYAIVPDAVTIKAGKKAKAIRISPKGNLEGAAEKTVKLHLTAGDGYTIGTTTPVIVKIIAAH